MFRPPDLLVFDAISSKGRCGRLAIVQNPEDDIPIVSCRSQQVSSWSPPDTVDGLCMFR